jgi:hypothetical protein
VTTGVVVAGGCDVVSGVIDLAGVVSGVDVVVSGVVVVVSGVVVVVSVVAFSSVVDEIVDVAGAPVQATRDIRVIIITNAYTFIIISP